MDFGISCGEILEFFVGLTVVYIFLKVKDGCKGLDWKYDELNVAKAFYGIIVTGQELCYWDFIFDSRWIGFSDIFA